MILPCGRKKSITIGITVPYQTLRQSTAKYTDQTNQINGWPGSLRMSWQTNTVDLPGKNADISQCWKSNMITWSWGMACQLLTPYSLNQTNPLTHYKQYTRTVAYCCKAPTGNDARCWYASCEDCWALSLLHQGNAVLHLGDHGQQGYLHCMLLPAQTLKLWRTHRDLVQTLLQCISHALLHVAIVLCRLCGSIIMQL